MIESSAPAPDTKELKEQVIEINRVARVVKGGRRFRFRALVVMGDKQGQVGMGIAKAGDVASAVDKATAQARKAMFDVPLHEHGTIPHEIQARHSGARVLLKPAGPGTGVIAGGAVRQILEAAGVRDVLSKSLGSSSKLNNCYATMKALKQLHARKPLAKTKPAVRSKSAVKSTKTETKPS